MASGMAMSTIAELSVVWTRLEPGRDVNAQSSPSPACHHPANAHCALLPWWWWGLPTLHEEPEFRKIRQFAWSKVTQRVRSRPGIQMKSHDPYGPITLYSVTRLWKRLLSLIFSVSKIIVFINSFSDQFYMILFLLMS